MSKPNSLLMFSGGIDSTWVLWNRVVEGLPTRVHHVNLYDREGRGDAENKASHDVIEWLNANGGGGLIDYSESTVDFGDIPYLTLNYHLWAYWAAVILAGPTGHQLTRVLVPHHAETMQTNVSNADHAYKQAVHTMTGQTIKTVYPLAGMNKEQIMRSLPPDLLALTWFCRKPTVDGGTCGQCHTCKRVLPHLGKSQLGLEEVGK